MIIELGKKMPKGFGNQPPFREGREKVILYSPCRWPEDHNLRLKYPIETVNINDPERLVEAADAVDAVQECPYRRRVPGSQGCVYACDFGDSRKRGGGCPNKAVTAYTDSVLK